MSILAFQKPEEVVMVESTDTKGVFEFRPLEPGFGTTIGNALRRILLSSLEGHANHFSWLEWDGERMCGKFMSYPVREDIPENINEQLIVELYSK